VPITYFLQQQHQQSLLLPGKLELARDETQHYLQIGKEGENYQLFLEV